MKTIREFYDKCEWEGGLSEFVFGYGVDTSGFVGTDLETLIAPIEKLKAAMEELETALEKLGYFDLE